MYGGGYNDLVFFCVGPFGAAYVARHRFAWSVSSLQKYSRSLARRVFGFRECSRGFPGVFSTLKSAPEASLGVFSTFGSTPVAFLAHFQPSKVLPRLSRRIFNPQKCSRSLARRVFNLREYSQSLTWRVLPQGVTLRQKHFQFGSNKNHHKSRSFYET